MTQSLALPSLQSPRLIIQLLTNMSTGMPNGQSALPGSKVEFHFLIFSPRLCPPQPTYPQPPISINGSITIHPAAGAKEFPLVLLFLLSPNYNSSANSVSSLFKMHPHSVCFHGSRVGLGHHPPRPGDCSNLLNMPPASSLATPQSILHTAN